MVLPRQAGKSATRYRYPASLTKSRLRSHTADMTKIRSSALPQLCGIALAAVTVFCGSQSARAEIQKPNIIYILADDLGWGDLGCYGQATLKTPHIDALARGGMKFTRHYSGSTVCAPSRCVLLTGKHTGVASIRGNADALLAEGEMTIAESLKAAGYETGAYGKWGVGKPLKHTAPNDEGFDQFFGYVNTIHAHNFWPSFLVRNGEVVRLRNEQDEPWLGPEFQVGGIREGAGVATVKKDYAPDLIEAEMLNFLEKDREAPFFLYYALNTPHTNNEAGRPPYEDGMEVPNYGEFAKKDWPQPEKGFARMMQMLDESVGKIRTTLKQTEQLENTLILLQ